MTENSYFSKQFIICLIISMSLILIMLFIGVNQGYNVTPEEANATLSEIEKLRAEVTPLTIFLNNSEIALVAIIPLIGILWMLFVQFNTGFALGSLAKALGWNQYLYASAILTSPVGLFEYAVYILVMAESLVLVYSALQKNFKERLTKHTWKTILLTVGLLFIGAIIEYIDIQV